LSNHKCSCGGKHEIIGGYHTVYGENPFEPNETFESNGRRYYYCDKNRKGELFYSHSDGFYYPVILPAPASFNG
jgi:hypothetical protein